MVSEVYSSNLSFLIFEHGLMFIPPLINASLFVTSAKMTLGNRSEALFEANKGFWIYLKNCLSICSVSALNPIPFLYATQVIH